MNEGQDKAFREVVKSCNTRELIGMLVEIRNDPWQLQVVQEELKSRRATIPQLAETFAAITAEKLGRLVEGGLPATQEAQDVDAITERLERLRKREVAAAVREIEAEQPSLAATPASIGLGESRASEAVEADADKRDEAGNPDAAIGADNALESTQKHTTPDGPQKFARPVRVRTGPRARGGPIAGRGAGWDGREEAAATPAPRCKKCDQLIGEECMCPERKTQRDEWIEWALEFADDLDKEERFGTAVPTGTARDTWVSLTDEFASATSARLRALARFLDGDT